MCWLAARFELSRGGGDHNIRSMEGLRGFAVFLVFLFHGVPGAGFGAWRFWALLPPMFVLTLVPTAALFLVIERPFSLAPKAARAQEPRVRLEVAP